jgi:serine/threonine protein kinase
MAVTSRFAAERPTTLRFGRSPRWAARNGSWENRRHVQHLFIAMEYLDGRTLQEHIVGRTLDSDEISKLGIQIAEALSAAHSKGVVHRDVKPGNIVVTDLGLVKVLDFGLA